MALIITTEHQGNSYTIQLDQQPDGTFRARIDDRSHSFAATRLIDNGWLLEMGSRRLVVHGAIQNKQRYVHVAGKHYTLAVVDERTRLRKQPTGGGSLTAPMPGQVIAVHASEGDTVTQGQTLVILEAMKMEIRVTAPHDGMVQRLLVAEGDVVERGQALVELT